MDTGSNEKRSLARGIGARIPEAIKGHIFFKPQVASTWGGSTLGPAASFKFWAGGRNQERSSRLCSCLSCDSSLSLVLFSPPSPPPQPAVGPQQGHAKFPFFFTAHFAYFGLMVLITMSCYNDAPGLAVGSCSRKTS
jgi:hypothetical protein